MENNENRVAEDNSGIESRIASGASWFFWIAGLSIINSILVFTGSDWNFIVGLGVTQFIDGIALAILDEVGNIASAIALSLDVLVAGIFVLFGFFARKRHNWAFIVGMVLYAIDGLIFLLVQDYLGMGFHVLALYFIFKGFKASRKIRELEQKPYLQPVKVADA
jgi:hypothetical protein